MDDPLVIKAKEFGVKAHAGLFRNNTQKLPLSEHLREVATLVELSGGKAEEIAAAWLHDTIEDTHITLEDIQKEFGDLVADIVDGLTDPIEFKGMPTLDRKTLQALRIQKKSDSVKRVKIADQTSNTWSVARDSIIDWDDVKTRHYVEGARRIVINCRGVSTFLEARFDEAHTAATKRYGQYSE